MKLPNTNNSLHLNAFKKGYRLALDNKDLSLMPATIRNSMELSRYFEEGFQQSYSDQQIAVESTQKSQWKKRFIWLIIMILGGLASSFSMIKSYEKEVEATQTNKTEPNNLTSLTLLSDEERKDLLLSINEQNKQKIISFSSIYPSSIKFTNPILVNSSKKVLKQGKVIPKNIKSLQFNVQTTEIKNNLKLQWIHQTSLIKEADILPSQTLQISSQINLASRWYGKWTIQIINEDKQTIFRYQFNYIKENLNDRDYSASP